jgi:excisionase family DNA binding protein
MQVHPLPFAGVSHMPEKLAYSIREAMEAADAGRTTIYQAIKDGALVARKRGKRTIILTEDLKAWLSGLKPLRSA